MEVIHTCPNVRYWSEVLYCTVLTHMNDVEVKAVDLEKKLFKFLVKVFRGSCKSVSGELCCPSTALICHWFGNMKMTTSQKILGIKLALVAQLDASPTKDQDPRQVGSILSRRSIMKYFLWSFSPFQ